MGAPLGLKYIPYTYMDPLGEAEAVGNWTAAQLPLPAEMKLLRSECGFILGLWEMRV